MQLGHSEFLMSDLDRFHCCATCIHYHVNTSVRPLEYLCKRLGYATHPTYKFDCWQPKEQVQRILQNSNCKRAE